MSIKSKIILNGIKKDLPTVKIIEPYQPEVIECETKEDFMEILAADKEKYNVMTTQKLNKTFKIPGYKITKIKGEICLRNIKPCEKLKTRDDVEDMTEINCEWSHINEEIKNIKDAFNQLSDQVEQIKLLLFNDKN